MQHDAGRLTVLERLRPDSFPRPAERSERRGLAAGGGVAAVRAHVESPGCGPAGSGHSDAAAGWTETGRRRRRAEAGRWRGSAAWAELQAIPKVPLAGAVAFLQDGRRPELEHKLAEGAIERLVRWEPGELVAAACSRARGHTEIWVAPGPGAVVLGRPTTARADAGRALGRRRRRRRRKERRHQ